MHTLLQKHRTRLAVDLLDASRERTWIYDAALLTVVLLLAGFSALHGFDAARLVTGDALYPVQMIEQNLLHYRPPLANRLFPDVAVHALLSGLTQDLLAQKIAAGVLLFSVSALAIGLYKGLAVFTLFVAIMVSQGFGFLDSACHYSLPLTVLIYQIARPYRVWGAAAMATIVFSDLMVVFPLVLMLAEESERDTRWERAGVALAAAAASVVYAEFGMTAIEFFVVLSLWVAVVAAAAFLGRCRALGVAVAIVFLIGAIGGVIYPRYALPMAASLLIAVTPLATAKVRWQYAATVAAILAIFFATVNTDRMVRTQENYACLAQALKARSIGAVAMDHWTAKPLSFAAREQGTHFVITQTDFEEGDSLLWMAPHAFFGTPTPWAIRNVETCAEIGEPADHCGHATLAPIASKEPICTIFELYRYTENVPRAHETAPGSKAEALKRRLASYVAKAQRRLDGRLPDRSIRPE